MSLKNGDNIQLVNPAFDGIYDVPTDEFIRFVSRHGSTLSLPKNKVNGNLDKFTVLRQIDPMKQVATRPIHVRKEIHRKIQLAAVNAGLSMGQWLASALSEKLDGPIEQLPAAPPPEHLENSFLGY